MLENQPSPDTDSRIAIIAQNPNIYNPFQEVIHHTLTPNQRLLVYKDGQYKMIEERKEGEPYPEDAFATDSIINHFATAFDVIFLFGEGIHMEYFQSPPQEGKLLIRNSRHVALRRDPFQYEIFTGYDFRDVWDALIEFNEHQIRKN